MKREERELREFWQDGNRLKPHGKNTCPYCGLGVLEDVTQGNTTYMVCTDPECEWTTTLETFQSVIQEGHESC